MKVGAPVASVPAVAGNGWRWIGIAVLLLLTAFTYRASFDAYFLLDDFGLLAIVRQFANPLEPFYREHIPGGLYYRPLGMMVWWLSQQAFGAVAAWHYLLNLGLLLAAAGTLWALVERGTGSRQGGFAAALVFALHPISMGTSLWLADRFDMLALIFGLLGLLATLDYSRRAESRHLWRSGVCFALALLSKEIALAPLAGAVVLCMASTSTLDRRRRWWAVLAAAVLVVAWFGVRTMVLATARTGLLLDRKSLFQLFGDGLQTWSGGWIRYVSYWPWLYGWDTVSAVAGLLLFTGLVALALWKRNDRGRRPLLLASLAMLVMTALLQLPILGLHTLNFGSEPSVIELVINPRYFYAALAATILVVASLVAGLGRHGIAVNGLSRLALLLVLTPWVMASQQATHRYRDETKGQRELVLAATEAIESAALSRDVCQIYLLDTGSWMFSWISDQAIKGVIADLPRIEHCLIQTEHTPWYHIVVVDRGADPAMFPLTTIPGDVYASDPPSIGRARIVSLNLSPKIDATKMTTALFLSWRDGQFVDVTSDVLSGRRQPGFLCNRNATQCPP